MKVTDFFVGFGPVVWSTTIGETRYGVRAILAGRLRQGPRHDLVREIDPDDEARTYRSASYPRKVLFALGRFVHARASWRWCWRGRR